MDWTVRCHYHRSLVPRRLNTKTWFSTIHTHQSCVRFPLRLLVSACCYKPDKSIHKVLAVGGDNGLPVESWLLPILFVNVKMHYCNCTLQTRMIIAVRTFTVRCLLKWNELDRHRITFFWVKWHIKEYCRRMRRTSYFPLFARLKAKKGIVHFALKYQTLKWNLGELLKSLV